MGASAAVSAAPLHVQATNTADSILEANVQGPQQGQPMSSPRLFLTQIRERDNTLLHGTISESPYARAEGILPLYGPVHFKIFEVKGENSFLLALAAAVHKALRNENQKQILRSRLGNDQDAKLTMQLCKIGQGFVTGKKTDTGGSAFKKLLSTELRKRGITELERALNGEPQIQSRRKQQKTMVMHPDNAIAGNESAHTIAAKAIKTVFSFLAVTVVALAPASTGTLNCSSNIVHDPVHDIIPEDEVRLRVVLCLRNGKDTIGALNCFDVTELENKSAHWVLGTRQPLIPDFFANRPIASSVVRTD